MTKQREIFSQPNTNDLPANKREKENYKNGKHDKGPQRIKQAAMS